MIASNDSVNGSKRERLSQWGQASPRSLARIAGGLYLINILLGIFSLGFVSSAIVVTGDAAATAHNILANELLYRSGLVAHIAVLLTNIPLAVIFYDLLRVVNRRFSLLVVFFTLVGTAVEGVALLNQFAPLALLEGGQYSSVFNTQQLQALAYMPLGSLNVSFDLPQVFYSFYLLSAAYLVLRSTFLPRAVGALLALAGLAYLTNSFATFLAPGFAASLLPYILLPGLIGEGSLTLWLLVKGVNDQRWKEQASAAGDRVPRTA